MWPPPATEFGAVPGAPATQKMSSLVAHVVRLARALRGRGVDVGTGDQMDGVRALAEVDLLDREEVRRALRIAFKVRRRHWPDFDAVFDDAFMSVERRSVVQPVAPPRRQSPVTPRVGPPATRSGLTSSIAFSSHNSVTDQIIPDPVARESAAPMAPLEGDLPGYSPEALLRKRPFDECSSQDLDAMTRLLEHLAPRLATRRSRRLVPVRGRGAIDLRRSFRLALATGGEPLSFARRARAIEVPRLVVLCDTSGSMDAHAPFLLTFVLALRRVVRRTEIFAFNTSLARLTPWLVRGNVGRTLERLATEVPDWSGGTRIGESLAEFVRTWLDELVNDRTIVLIFSDGLDRGDAALVGDAMRAVHARARRVIWMNPLAGDARYEPTARAMQVAMPFIDRFAPAHNLESLERLLSELAA